MMAPSVIIHGIISFKHKKQNKKIQINKILIIEKIDDFETPQQGAFNSMIHNEIKAKEDTISKFKLLKPSSVTLANEYGKLLQIK